jgi:D-serine deaminase-like pyridoxal phosphate-dependent protein
MMARDAIVANAAGSKRVSDVLRARYDRATAHLDPPLAIVDLGAFDRNAADMVRRAAGRPIRVASKSLRCRYLVQHALKIPGFKGVMCYALPEALWLHAAGTSDDLLVAYPTVSKNALQSLVKDDAARRHITIMVDSLAHLDAIGWILGDGHPEIRVCLDLDVSWRPIANQPLLHIGTWRSPLRTPQQAADFARAITQRKGFRLVGVMGYEGQIAGVGNAPPGHPVKGLLVRLIQDRSVKELKRRRAEAISMVKAVTNLEFVNGGGTGSLHSTAEDASVTELAGGSGLIGPALFDAYRTFNLRPALLYALPVVRRPERNIATLFSGGYLASGTGTADRLPQPHLPHGLRLTGTEGAGEVQTPVRGAAANDLQPGDRVWMRHAKAGELAERFAQYHLIQDDDQITTVPTYRGEGQSFG